MNAGAQTILQSWSTPVGVDLALGVTALVYARGWFRLRSALPELISFWRLAAFFAGIFFVWLAIGSPLNAFDDALLTVHMLQHLLLMSVGPPLILLGAPQLPLLHGLPQSFARGVVSPILRTNSVKRLGHFVSRPAFCWLAAAFALIGWHIPAIFALALRWNWLHELEHATFLATGLLFWWPVIQPWPSVARWPRWSIPLYLFCATLPCDALSAFLAFCDRVIYRAYFSAPRLIQMSPLEDQQFAAVLMWTCVTIIFIVPAVIVTMQLLSPVRMHSSAATQPAPSQLASPPLDGTRLEIT
ncbi:MAG: cytochrome c oxidase assembly protein [Candidatus Acidiferrales bacterium]